MARNETRRGLDKSTRSALSGLDSYLATLEYAGIEPDEWTAEMAHEKAISKGIKTTRDAIRHRLKRDVENGKLTKREILIGRHLTHVYKVKS